MRQLNDFWTNFNISATKMDKQREGKALDKQKEQIVLKFLQRNKLICLVLNITQVSIFKDTRIRLKPSKIVFIA